MASSTATYPSAVNDETISERITVAMLEDATRDYLERPMRDRQEKWEHFFRSLIVKLANDDKLTEADCVKWLDSYLLFCAFLNDNYTFTDLIKRLDNTDNFPNFVSEQKGVGARLKQEIQIDFRLIDEVINTAEKFCDARSQGNLENYENAIEAILREIDRTPGKVIVELEVLKAIKKTLTLVEPVRKQQAAANTKKSFLSSLWKTTPIAPAPTTTQSSSTEYKRPGLKKRIDSQTD